MTVFDTNKLMAETQEAGESTYTTLPDGEYKATIGDKEDDLKLEHVTGSKDGRDYDFIALRVQWVLRDVDPKLLEQLNLTGRDEVRVPQDLTIETDEGGRIAWGPNTNVPLGNVREGLGQNQKGKPWNLGMLRGAGPAMVIVGSRENKKDEHLPAAERRKYNQVNRVGRLQSARR